MVDSLFFPNKVVVSQRLAGTTTMSSKILQTERDLRESNYQIMISKQQYGNPKFKAFFLVWDQLPPSEGEPTGPPEEFLVFWHQAPKNFGP